MGSGIFQMAAKLYTDKREQRHFTEAETMMEMFTYSVLTIMLHLQVEGSAVRLKMLLVQIKLSVSIFATQPVSRLLMV